MDQNTKQEVLALWLPGLFGTGEGGHMREQLWPTVRRFCPGLATRLLKNKGFAQAFTPTALPCSPQEMAAYVAELERFTTDALRGGQAAHEIIVASVKNAELLRRQDEEQALQALAGSENLEASQERFLKIKAQRLLAWLWLQQSNQAEIKALVHKVNASTSSLTTYISAENPLHSDFSQELGLSQEDGQSDWRSCLESMLLLLTQDEQRKCVFVAEGACAQELQACDLSWQESTLGLSLGAAVDAPSLLVAYTNVATVLPKAKGLDPSLPLCLCLPNCEA